MSKAHKFLKIYKKYLNYVRNHKAKCTNESRGFCYAVYECCWEHPLSEGALLAGIRQELSEQDEAKFQGGGVKVGLEEEQEPITAQGVEKSLLLTGEEQGDDGQILFMSLEGH